jgi:hypothetical protein
MRYQLSYARKGADAASNDAGGDYPLSKCGA